MAARRYPRAVPTRARLAAALAALASTLVPAARAADPVPPGGIADLTGPRALGLGGSVGVISGNDGIFVNPAAVAARRRYSAETLFTIERRGAETVGKYLGGSVVDAIASAPAAFTFGYFRSMDHDQAGNLITLGIAGPVASKLFVGAQGRYLTLKGTERVDAVTADAGLWWEVSDGISLGVAGYNLIPTGHELAAPRGLGAGVSVGSDTSLKVTADWRADFDRLGKTSNRYGVGAELLLGNMFPLRAGYIRDEVLSTTWWTAGGGIVTSGGVAVDLGYRQSLDAPDARIISVAVKAYFLDQ